MSTQEWAEKFHKLIIRQFEKWKVCSSFIDNICADLTDMQLNLIKGLIFYYVLLMCIVNKGGSF